MITFYCNNLVSQANISADTENAMFPVSNINDSRRSKVYRSLSNSSAIVFDFLETSDIDSFVIVDNPRDGFGISTITIEANGTDNWASPAFTQSFPFSIEHGVGLLELESVISYRFVRLVLTSTLGYCEIANLFIGKKTETNRGVNNGWTYKDDDNSIIKTNRYGQKFIDILNRQREFSGTISNLDKDNLDKIFEVYDSKGRINPFFIKIGCADAINNINRFTAMVYFTSIPNISNRFFNNYNISLQMDEAK